MAHKALPIAAGVVVGAVASALLNCWLAHKAERRNPPLGRFVTVDGTRLIAAALKKIGVPPTVVLGHSMGDLGGAGAGRAVSATDPGVSSCVRILLSERSSRCGDPIAASDTGSGRSVELHLIASSEADLAAVAAQDFRA